MSIHPFVLGIMFTFILLVLFGSLWVFFFGEKRAESVDAIVPINEADEKTVAALIELGYLYKDETGISNRKKQWRGPGRGWRVRG